MPIDTNAMGQAIANEITTADTALPAPLPTTEAIRLLMMQALARGIAAELIPKLTFADHADVNLTGLADGDMLRYNASTQKWEVQAPDPGNYLPLAGGTLTGDLTINKATPGLYLTNQAGGYENRAFYLVNTQDTLKVQRRTGTTFEADLLTLDRAAGTLFAATMHTSVSGTAAAPAFAFATDTNTGVYNARADTIGLAAGGAAILNIMAGGARAQLNGSVAAPFYSWGADSDTGLFRSAADELGLSTGGTGRIYISNATTLVSNLLYASGGLRLPVV